MKKKILIIALILAVALSIVLAFTLGAGATEAEPIVTIGGKALVMENSVNIRYLVTISDRITSIGNSAFSGCTNLTDIIIPDNVTTIGEYAFFKCQSLVSLTIPSGVEIINNATFQYCTGLTSIIIPNSITTISSYAFFDCTSLTDVYYDGTEAEWNAISIGNSNDCLLNANIHFVGDN